MVADHHSPATALTRYSDLVQFGKWLASEDEIKENFTDKVKPPMLPEVPVPVVPVDAQQALLATCAGKSL